MDAGIEVHVRGSSLHVWQGTHDYLRICHCFY